MRRNFYHEHPSVTARSQAEVDEYRRKREIHVVGTGVPRPVTNFEEASFPGEHRAGACMCSLSTRSSDNKF